MIERYPRRGEKLAAERFELRPGGQIATAVLAGVRLGLSAAYVGAVGDDPAAEVALGPLRRAGVDLSGVKRVAGVASRSALILVEAESGERTIIEHRDPALALRPDDLDRRAIETSRALLLDTEDPEAAVWAAAVARGAGVPVVLDADRADPATLAVVRAVDFPIVSQGFAEQFSSGSARTEALRALAGPATTMAVVTLGARGAVALHGRRTLVAPTTAAPIRDTTGAGDVFRGAFAWALLQGLGPEQVLHAANAAALLACRGLGAQEALPDRRALESVLRNRPARGPGR